MPCLQNHCPAYREHEKGLKTTLGVTKLPWWNVRGGTIQNMLVVSWNGWGSGLAEKRKAIQDVIVASGCDRVVN